MSLIQKKPLRIISLNHSDIRGGAARAAYRIHRALLASGVDSRMWVNDASTGDWTVNGPTKKIIKALNILRQVIGKQLCWVLKTNNPVIHSSAILPSRWTKHINTNNADIIHLHWVQGEMLSVAAIGNLRKPVVWTIHDMWAFCGAEHYAEDFRWRGGYRKNNRPLHEFGFDLNRWTWKRKRKHWKTPIHIVAPSRWLADCARASKLMRNWPVTVVPNAIDTDTWQPVDKSIARCLLHLPPKAPLLLFGAIGGGADPRKGYDLLRKALQRLRGQKNISQLVIFGQLAPRQPENLGFPVHYAGHLHDDISLRVLYSAADVMLIPSRQDNLPNTGVEALACGTPVVAFDTCGLPDIVQHKKSGYLARAYDVDDFACGIQWVLANKRRHSTLCTNARTEAVAKFSFPVVAKQYLQVYQAAITAAKK